MFTCYYWQLRSDMLVSVNVKFKKNEICALSKKCLLKSFI